jgi:hypothetical protein
VLSGTSIAPEFKGDTELHIVGFGPNTTWLIKKVDPLRLSSAELNTYAGQYINTKSRRPSRWRQPIQSSPSDGTRDRISFWIVYPDTFQRDP